MRYALFALFLGCSMKTPAVEVRVASFNIGAHFGTSYFDYSLGDPGTPDYDSVRDIISRIDADVVALEEIHSIDLQGSPDDVDALAAATGYPYLYITPLTNAFDTSLRVIFLSKFPFINTGQVNSPTGAKEMTRLHPVVKVDVPGTANDLTLIAAHLKSGTTSADRFRRAVEMKRLTSYLAASGLTTDDNYVVVGDFNPSSTNTTFTALPADLPTSYVLGSDITFPVSYSTNMLSYFSSPNAVKLDLRQLDNSPSTYGTTFSNGPTLDLIMVSPVIAGKPVASEVYNSNLDVSNSVGLPKAGSPLAATTSATASDHYAVFADLEMDSDFPNLALALSASSVNEGSPDGQVSLTVTLPAVRTSALTITLTSDDAAAVPVTSSLVIPAGSLTGAVAIHTPRNFLADSQHSVTLTATAVGLDPASAVLQVNDVDGPYIFNAPAQTVTENFDGFTGTHDPASWLTTAGTWQGVDNGTSATAGLRAYGTNGEVALGYLANGTSSSAQAPFENRTGNVITALRVSLDVEAWRVPANGALDGISAELLVGAQSIPIPGLSFVTSPSQAVGSVNLSADITGLSIAPDATFDLKISFNAGSIAGALPTDVFINEFHYDNTSTDSGEFVEIAVGPGYQGTLSNLALVIYNGSNGQALSTHTLDTFTAGAVTASGHRLFYKMIAGLQNDVEGFAITSGTSVLHFISYEGAFTATTGPALGMLSTNIGVSQSGSDSVGMAALGLTGTGGSASEFAWMKFVNIAHSPGQPNNAQSFTVPTLPARGLAVDNLQVTLLTDYDQDGIADVDDPDDDNDGQSDTYETAFGTLTRDATSRFLPMIAKSATAPYGLQLSFLGAMGVSYTIETSTTLAGWQDLTTVTGNGSMIAVSLPVGEARRFFRIKAGQ